ncbi:hypothetical protein V8E52_009771 [Russula decolorans]
MVMWRWRGSCSLSSLVLRLELFWRWSMASCRGASSGSCCSTPVHGMPDVSCRLSSLLGSWISAWGSSGCLQRGDSWRCTSAVTNSIPLPVPSGGVTGSGCIGSYNSGPFHHERGLQHPNRNYGSLSRR